MKTKEQFKEILKTKKVLILNSGTEEALPAEYIELFLEHFDRLLEVGEPNLEVLSTKIDDLSFYKNKGITRGGINKFEFNPDSNSLVFDPKQIEDLENISFQMVLDIMNKKQNSKYKFMSDGYREMLASEIKSKDSVEPSASYLMVNLLSHLPGEICGDMIESYKRGDFTDLETKIEEKYPDILKLMNSAYISEINSRNNSDNRSLKVVCSKLKDMYPTIYTSEVLPYLGPEKVDKNTYVISLKDKKDLIESLTKETQIETPQEDLEKTQIIKM